MSILEQVQVISDKVDLINQNYQHSINLTVGLLSLSIAIAGVALYNLTKMWVNKRVEKELETIKLDLERELKKYISDNQQFRWASGSQSVSSTNGVNSITIANLVISKRSYEELPYKIELFSTNNPSKKIEYTHSIYNGIFHITLLNYNISDGLIKWTITWMNDELYK